MLANNFRQKICRDCRDHERDDGQAERMGKNRAITTLAADCRSLRAETLTGTS